MTIFLLYSLSLLQFGLWNKMKSNNEESPPPPPKCLSLVVNRFIYIHIFVISRPKVRPVAWFKNRIMWITIKDGWEISVWGFTLKTWLQMPMALCTFLRILLKKVLTTGSLKGFQNQNNHIYPKRVQTECKQELGSLRVWANFDTLNFGILKVVRELKSTLYRGMTTHDKIAFIYTQPLKWGHVEPGRCDVEVDGCHFPDDAIGLQFCKMLPWGEVAEGDLASLRFISYTCIASTSTSK